MANLTDVNPMNSNDKNRIVCCEIVYLEKIWRANLRLNCRQFRSQFDE